MFRVENMSAEDFQFAAQITDLMDWNLTVEDFAFMKKLEPKGCFVLVEDSERIGVATTVSFGTMGWFGNLIVKQSHRRKGAGSLLVTHSVKYLLGNNVRTVGLYAYVDRIPFYRRLGFEYDSDFVVLNGKSFSSSVDGEVRRAGKEDIVEVLNLDSSCFGTSRKKLLEPVLLNPENLCYVSTEKRRVNGYIAAKVYGQMAEVGPLVCPKEREDQAADLLKAVLSNLGGIEVFIYASSKARSILDILEERRFTEKFHVGRMFRGSPAAGDCIYLAESLERG